MTAPTYTAAQREDGSWGLKCPDGRIIGTAKTEAEAQFGVDVAIWKQENVVAGLLEALEPFAAVVADIDVEATTDDRGALLQISNGMKNLGLSAFFAARDLVSGVEFRRQ